MRWIFMVFAFFYTSALAQDNSVIEFSLTRTAYAKTYFNSSQGVLNITAPNAFKNLNLKNCNKPTCSIQSMKFKDNKKGTCKLKPFKHSKSKKCKVVFNRICWI